MRPDVGVARQGTPMATSSANELIALRGLIGLGAALVMPVKAKHQGGHTERCTEVVSVSA